MPNRLSCLATKFLHLKSFTRPLSIQHLGDILKVQKQFSRRRVRIYLLANPKPHCGRPKRLARKTMSHSTATATTSCQGRRKPWEPLITGTVRADQVKTIIAQTRNFPIGSSPRHRISMGETPKILCQNKGQSSSNPAPRTRPTPGMS